jgi:hypothetical protein
MPLLAPAPCAALSVLAVPAAPVPLVPPVALLLVLSWGNAGGVVTAVLAPGAVRYASALSSSSRPQALTASASATLVAISS